MSTPLNQTTIQFGREPRQDFNVHCEPLDWQPIDVTFPITFPSPDVRVFVTSNDFNVDSEPDNLPVVGTVQDVKPAGFRLWGRNPSMCQRVSAGFNWLAIAETPNQEHPSDADLRLGVVQPRHVAAACSAEFPFLFPTVWQVTLGPKRELGDAKKPPVVLATACNLNAWAGTVDPISPHAVEVPWERNAAMVAVVQQPKPNGFLIKATNSDPFRGNCAFYHVALAARRRNAASGVLVETGRAGAKKFAATGIEGDWQVWEIEFQDPFLTPPVVLLTVNDLFENGGTIPDRGSEIGRAVAAVGIAQNVTTHGFTIMARNSDCAEGFAGFFWAAFGCQRFCA